MIPYFILYRAVSISLPFFQLYFLDFSITNNLKVVGVITQENYRRTKRGGIEEWRLKQH